MRRLLPMLVLMCAACASAPPSTPQISPEAAALSAKSTADVARLHADLEEAYRRASAQAPSPAVQSVDIDAAASLPIPDNRLVRSAVTLFTTTMRSDIQAYLARSARYKKMIDRILSEAGVPKAFAYLPVIESGYSQTMTSRAGARGMWQFMDETAREYGLRVDWWVDERADPERSTRAAAGYIRDLYRQFNDWSLVLAAYNGGPGRVRRALSSTGTSTFWDLCELAAVPKETRGYVPTFYATLMIASDPASYGFKLASDDEPEAKLVEVDGPVSLRYIARVAGVDADLLRQMNPALRHAVVPPGKTSVRVPARAAELVASRASTLRNDDPDMTICSFRLRDGDSLKRLARSLGTSVDTLVAMNGLRSPSAVGEGDSVYLPVRARDLGPLLQAEVTYYAVRHGDTLSSIARKYNLSVDELRDLNDLERGKSLRSGQKLRVTAPRTLTAGGM